MAHVIRWPSAFPCPNRAPLPFATPTPLVPLQLNDSQAAVRKRATTCLGLLAICVSDRLLQSMVDQLLQGIQAPREGADVRPLVQTVGTVSRQVGFRLGRHLPRIIPLFLSFVSSAPTDAEDGGLNDLRENCFQVRDPSVSRLVSVGFPTNSYLCTHEPYLCTH